MSNTVVQRTIYGGGKDRKIVRLINLTSDGTQETNTVIFSNAAFSALPAIGSLLEIEATGSSCICSLAWDQTTDSPICNLNPSFDQQLCFKDVGGVHNPNATGATGDILLSTTGLASGNAITLKFTVKQD